MSTEESAAWGTSGSLIIDGISYIPSSVLLSGTPKLTLKDDRAFGVLDPRGEAPRSVHPGAELGLFYEDTRFLAVWETTINGAPPVSLASEIRHDGRVLVISMTNRDLPGINGSERIPRDTLLIRRILAIHDDRFHEVLAIRNFDRTAHTLQIEHWAGSRFEDIFEVRGFKREKRGRNLSTLSHVEGEKPETRLHDSTLRHEALDGTIAETRIVRHFPAASIRQAPGVSSVFTRVEVPPHGDIEFRTTVEFSKIRPDEVVLSTPTQKGSSFGWTHDPLSVWLQSVGDTAKSGLEPRAGALWKNLEIESSHLPYDQGLARSASDLRMLLSSEGMGTFYPYAGIPWFSAPFGRDGIITALQLLPWTPEISTQVLEFIFRHLGTKNDPFTEEEPGRVFHELRRGEMARLREVPFVPYYGTIDATPLAIILLREHFRWTGDLSFVRRHWKSAQGALNWMAHNSSLNPAGFLSYARQSPTGLVNQGWKDSHDSVMHADGRAAEGAISLSEVQAYAWRAWRGASKLAELLGDTEAARNYSTRAQSLQKNFNEYFWLLPEQYPALALDGDLRPCRVKSSNMGHCLWSGILDSEKAQHVRDHLMDPGMFSGLGLRTLADTEKAYNPMSYHNGSIWPHDNALILEGLRRYGFTREARRLSSALTEVLLLSPDLRMPELYCGFRRRGTESPIPYEVACRPQAWAAGSVFHVLKSYLGLHRDGPGDPIVLRDPILPDPLHRLNVSGLTFPEGELSFEVKRVPTERGHEPRFRTEAIRTTGDLKCVVIRSS